MEANEEVREEEVKEEKVKEEEVKEEKPIVEVRPPIEEEVFEPLVRRFADQRGLGEDTTQATLRLAKLLKNAGVDPYESLKTISEYVNNIMGTLSKIPDTEVTKPIKDAIMARTIGQASQELQDAMLKTGMPQHFEDEIAKKTQSILKEFIPYLFADKYIKTIAKTLAETEEKPREVAFTKVENEEAKFFREMMMDTYRKLLDKAFETKTAEDKEELKETLKSLMDKIEKATSEKKGFKEVMGEIVETCEAFGIPKPWEKSETKGLSPEQYIELKKLDLDKYRIELEDRREKEKWKREQEAEKKKMDYVFKMFKPFVDRLGEKSGEIVEVGIKKLKESPKTYPEKSYTDYGFICPDCGTKIIVYSGEKPPKELPEEVKCPNCGKVFKKQAIVKKIKK